MEYRYEYEEVDTDMIGFFTTLGIYHDKDSIAYKCTIYDDDTGEELAVGYGWSEREARADAKNNL